MNKLETFDERVKSATKTLCSLVQDIDYEILLGMSASDYVKYLWNFESILATHVIEHVVRMMGNDPHLAHAIDDAIIKIADKKFDDICFDISRKHSTPDMTRMLINSCLLFRQHKKAICNIDDTIRNACNAFLKNNLEEFTLVEIIKQACIFRRTELHHDISLMLSSLSTSVTPQLHIIDKKTIEVISNGMASGELYLKDIIKDKKTSIYEKVAAIFTLGCENNPSFYSYFNTIFQEFYQNPKNTVICNEVIGAILYCSYNDDISSFILERLKQLRTDQKMVGGFLWSRYRHKVCISKRLLIGCSVYEDYYWVEELQHWLDHEQKEVQALAVLALEKQGIKSKKHEKILKSEIKFIRDFEKEPVMTDLLKLRQYKCSSATFASDESGERQKLDS